MFTGDTLCAGTVGRTDFPTGDVATLRASLKRLSALEKTLPIYAGHEEETDLETERKNNPFLLDL